MQKLDNWAVGVDLGGTKLEVACVDKNGRIHHRIRRPTRVQDGTEAVIHDIERAIHDLQTMFDTSPRAIGVGVAGQIALDNGKVAFAPNLGWQHVPLQTELRRVTAIPTLVTNDVRAAAWGEYRFGAGQGVDNLLCLFVGTGIGGGVIVNGRLLTGCSNTAGELGHVPIDLNGPTCHCGSQGCLEALASGWAIAQAAQTAITGGQPQAGQTLLALTNGQVNAVTAAVVAQAAHAGDPLAQELIDHAAQALISGVTGFVNAFNPCRVVLGGGVIEGMPELVERIATGVRKRGLAAATAPVAIVPAQQHNDAGVMGAADLAVRPL